jgi:hypothetical protein
MPVSLSIDGPELVGRGVGDACGVALGVGEDVGLGVGAVVTGSETF